MPFFNTLILSIDVVDNNVTEISIKDAIKDDSTLIVGDVYIDIIDPTSIKESVKDYIKMVILVLEEETIIPTPQ